MFDYLAMPYKDSDLIALVCWHKCMDFGVETHLGSGVMSMFPWQTTPAVCVVNEGMWCLSKAYFWATAGWKYSTFPSALQHVRNYMCSWLYIAASLCWIAYYFLL